MLVMPVKTRKIKEYKLEKILKNIQDVISRNKYLNDAKYFKNNYWSTAHFESWAMQAKAGGCSTCHNDYYYATLENKRSLTQRGGYNNSYPIDISSHFCPQCVDKIEEIINFKFKRF